MVLDFFKCIFLCSAVVCFPVFLCGIKIDVQTPEAYLHTPVQVLGV